MDFIFIGFGEESPFVRQMGPLPGQESIRLAKKGGGSSFPEAGIRRFSPANPLSPLLFAETKKGDSV